MRFSDEITRGAPAALALAPEIIEALNWLEDQGAVEPFSEDSSRSELRFASLYPKSAGVPEDAQSLVSFHRFEDFYYDYANATESEVKSRLLFFA
ncbi:MAG: hypothetical protein AAFQ82_14500, partial [Myxococcota bacterium]